MSVLQSISGQIPSNAAEDVTAEAVGDCVSFRPCAVVPCYNHHESVAAVVNALRDTGLPVAVVDDGSNDPAPTVLRKLASSSPGVTVIRHVTNRGKGAAVKTGLQWAAGEGYSHIVQIDADGQHCVSDLSCFLTESERHPDALIAGMPVFDASAPLVRRWGRLLSVFLVWIETRTTTVRDPLCGFRVYPVEPTIRVIAREGVGDRMQFDPEIVVKLLWSGMPARSLRTQVVYPPGNSSNFRYLRDNVTMVGLHVRLLLRSLIAARRR